MVQLSSYDGPVSVLVDDDLAVEGTVSARSYVERGGLQGWRGTLLAPVDIWAALRATRVRLRLPDGQEGDVVVTGTNALAGGRLEFTGSGPAPF
jgi:hypothetical protein